MRGTPREEDLAVMAWLSLLTAVGRLCRALRRDDAPTSLSWRASGSLREREMSVRRMAGCEERNTPGPITKAAPRHFQG